MYAVDPSRKESIIFDAAGLVRHTQHGKMVSQQRSFLEMHVHLVKAKCALRIEKGVIISSTDERRLEQYTLRERRKLEWVGREVHVEGDIIVSRTEPIFRLPPRDSFVERFLQWGWSSNPTPKSGIRTWSPPVKKAPTRWVSMAAVSYNFVKSCLEKMGQAIGDEHLFPNRTYLVIDKMAQGEVAIYNNNGRYALQRRKT